MNRKKLQDLESFVEEMEMTVLRDEEQILLEGMGGASTSEANSCKNTNCVPGCACPPEGEKNYVCIDL